MVVCTSLYLRFDIPQFGRLYLFSAAFLQRLWEMGVLPWDPYSSRVSKPFYSRFAQTSCVHTLCWAGFTSLSGHWKISTVLKLWFCGSSKREWVTFNARNKKSSLRDSEMVLEEWMMRECNLSAGNRMDRRTGGQERQILGNLHHLVH